MIINREKKIKFSYTFESIKNTIKICCKLQINIILFHLNIFHVMVIQTWTWKTTLPYFKIKFSTTRIYQFDIDNTYIISNITIMKKARIYLAFNVYFVFIFTLINLTVFIVFHYGSSQFYANKQYYIDLRIKFQNVFFWHQNNSFCWGIYVCSKFLCFYQNIIFIIFKPAFNCFARLSLIYYNLFIFINFR